MASIERIVPVEIRERFEVHEWRNALPILSVAYPDEWSDILQALREFRLLRSELSKGGGSKSQIANRLDRVLLDRGWVEKAFDINIQIDGAELSAPTHKVDCIKNRIAVEVEWNNKDPFYDRDLNNFRLLFEMRAIDVGVIITRCDEIQQIVEALGRGKSFGNSTTHMSKLLPRLHGGGGGGCPIAVFGISAACYEDDVADL